MECPRDQAEVCEAGCGAGGRIQRTGGHTIMAALCRNYIVSFQGLLADVEVYSGSGKCSNLKIAPIPSTRYFFVYFSLPRIV